MQNRSTLSAALLAGASALILSACGGGGDGGAATPPVATPAPPAAETFVTVEGAIDGFGSIIVNGTRYDTDSAEVRVDGRDASLSDLSVGQIVALRARRNAEGELPTALRVRYEEVLEGPVDSISADGRSLVILGQTVFLTDDTVFEDDLDPATIAVGDLLEVSGSFTADGDIVASYVEVSDEVDGDYEVHGTVGALDEAAQTFRVRGLKIGYATAELDDFDDGETLSNGDKVEVEGSTFLNDGTLIATRVEYEGDDLDELDGDEDEDGDIEEAEIEGFITAFTDAGSFEVAGVPVITTADTEFEDCAPGDLRLDLEVEVEGTFDADGVLVADEVECEVEADQFITAELDAVDVDAGTITLLGLTVLVDEDTSYQDKSEARLRPFGLADLMAGDVVRVQLYRLSGDGDAVAKRIRREDADDFDGPEVKGAVEALGEDSLVVAGVTVVFDAATEYELDDDAVSRDAFLDAVAPGDRVEVEGVEDADGNLLAREIERDDDEGDADGEDGDD